MSDLYLDQATSYLQEESARKSWFRARCARVLANTEAHDILEKFGVKVRASSDRGESIPCPFHGDNRPSAKVHPANSGGPSHLWCYVCRKNWNAIQIWMEFEQCSYSTALYRLEKYLNLPQVPFPSGKTFRPEPNRVQVVQEKLEAVERIFRNRVRDSKIPREVFLKFSVAMDRLWSALETQPDKVMDSIPEFLSKFRDATS